MFNPNRKSAHLVAPELKPALNVIPEIEITLRNLGKIRKAINAGVKQSGASANSKHQSSDTQGVTCRQHTIANVVDGSKVRILVYQPHSAPANAPVAMHLHGGGFIMGCAELNHESNRTLAQEMKCIVVSVDYRLAPEHPFPAALHDAYSALAWIYDQHQELSCDTDRIALMGESAGGGLAACLAQFVRDRNQYRIHFLLLDSPMLDNNTGMNSSSTYPYCGEYSWLANNNQFAWECYLGPEANTQVAPSYAVAATMDNLHNLPATFMVIGALDLFVGENLQYANRLIQCGVALELHVIPGAFHAYGAAGPGAPQVQQSQQLKLSALARAWQPEYLPE